MVKKKKNREKSKRNAFIPHIMECAYYTEKTRRDYLRKCSEHFNRLLYDCLVDSKCRWLKREDDQFELEKSDNNEHVADYIKNGVPRKKLYPVLHEVLGPKKQKKKKKKCTKKQDLPEKASVTRLRRSGGKSIDASAAAE